MAIAFFGLRFDFTMQRLGLYCVSVALAFFISFLFSFIMGTSVIWLKNSFFLDNLRSLVLRLFSGAIVPLWFFPGWLNRASDFLPFRYIVFEPISILLGKTPMEQIPGVLLMQVLWIGLLFGMMSFIWAMGRRHIMIQGG